MDEVGLQIDCYQASKLSLAPLVDRHIFCAAAGAAVEGTRNACKGSKADVELKRALDVGRESHIGQPEQGKDEEESKEAAQGDVCGR